MKQKGGVTRVWIAAKQSNVTSLNTAQYCMFVDLHMQPTPGPPTVHLLETIGESSHAKQRLDLEHYIHWSSHLLAYIGA